MEVSISEAKQYSRYTHEYIVMLARTDLPLSKKAIINLCLSDLQFPPNRFET